jgi:hypothetical protein
VFFIKKMRTRVTEGHTTGEKIREGRSVCGGGTCVRKERGIRGKRDVEGRVVNAINEDFGIT